MRYVQCLGFTNGNSDRQMAKRPLQKDWTKSTMSEDKVQQWINVGGWVGMIVPDDVIVVDVDDMGDADLLDSILSDYSAKYACMKTLKGRQFFFKAPDKAIKGAAGVYCGMTLSVDYRTAGKNQVILPKSEACRTWEKEYVDDMELDELPRWLYPLKVSKHEDFDFSEGSRNDAIHRHGTRLIQQGYDKDDLLETLEIINRYILEEPLEDEEISGIVESLWRFKESDDFEPMKDGDKKQLNIKNIQKFLDDKGISLFYDEMSRTEFINFGCGAKIFDDYDLTKLWDIVNTAGFRTSRDMLVPIIDFIAHSNSVHPVQKYLKQQYETYKAEFENNTDFIREMYDCLEVVDEHELSYTMFRRWLIQTVQIAFNNEGKLKAENVLVLQGKQGCFKTTFLKNLSPDSQWMKDGVTLDPSNKDSVSRAIDHWLVELGELDSTMKSEQSLLKAFLSEPRDVLRRPYNRRASTHNRMTSFCASVNKEEFLKDETGARRFWILKVGNIDVDKQKAINLARFWAYCYHLWKNSLEVSYITGEELQLLQESAKQFNVQDEACLWLDSIIDESQPEQVIQLIKLFDEARKEYPSITLPRLRNAITMKGLKTSKKNNKKMIHICMNSLMTGMF